VYFDRVVQVDPPDWGEGRVVLVGDACRCGSPLAGQSASMAVAGAYMLSDLLRQESDMSRAMAAYQRILKPVIARQQAAARRIARWFVPASECRLSIRNSITRLHLAGRGRVAETHGRGQRLSVLTRSVLRP
jgi:2-polyprenyl-6-methoxyphenol hydroxylase-like FAD-dependent oxidoreductase